MNCGLSLSSAKDFDFITGVSNLTFNLPADYDTDIALNKGTIYLNLNNIENKVLLEGNLPFSLTASTAVTVTPTSGTPVTYNVPFIETSIYPLNVTISIYKNSYDPANLIYSTPESLNSLLTASIDNLPATVTTIATATTFLAGLNGESINLNTNVPFEYVDTNKIPCTSCVTPSCYSTGTNGNVEYLFYINIATPVTTGTTNSASSVLGKLAAITSGGTITLGATTLSLVLNSNYFISALEVSK